MLVETWYDTGRQSPIEEHLRFAQWYWLFEDIFRLGFGTNLSNNCRTLVSTVLV